MSSQLRITVRFLSGRYHGDEWPPAPARLFQALVAGANAGCRMLSWPQSRVALSWLERLPPPQIIAPEAVDGCRYKSYGPNNDSDARKVIELVRHGRSLPDAMRKESMIATKHYRPHLVDGNNSAIHYLWPLPDTMTQDDHAQSKHVCRLARNILALGWGIDVIVGEGRIVPTTTLLPAGKRFTPAQGSGSIILKSPKEGFLNDIERTYDAFRKRTVGEAADADTRLRVYRPVPYRVADEPLGRLFVPFDLLDVQGEERQAFRWQDGMVVAAWMRHAAKQRFLHVEGWAQGRVDSYVCAHTAKGEESNRLSYVPLPSIGHAHSDGRYRRALIVLPFNDENAEESLSILYRMAGDPLQTIDSDKPVAWLGESDQRQDKTMLNRYVGSSTVWLSVTPVVLHGRVYDDGHFRPRKVEKLILQAFTESGYPAECISEFSYQPAPFWSGLGAARQVQVPRHLAKWPRYHVRVLFNAPIKGPILAGIGRHYGLGLFAAMS